MKQKIEERQDRLNQLKLDVIDLEIIKGEMLTDEQVVLIDAEIFAINCLIEKTAERLAYDMEYLYNLGIID